MLDFGLDCKGVGFDALGCSWYTWYVGCCFFAIAFLCVVSGRALGLAPWCVYIIQREVCMGRGSDGPFFCFFPLDFLPE